MGTIARSAYKAGCPEKRLNSDKSTSPGDVDRPMPPSEACLNARTSLEEIRTLKRDFDVAYDLAGSSGKQDDITKAQDLKVSLESQMTASGTTSVMEAPSTLDVETLLELSIKTTEKKG